MLYLTPVKVWAYWLFGLAFMVAGALATLTIGRAVTLECTRTGGDAGQCRLGESRGYGWRRRTIQMQDLLGARTEVRWTGFVANMALVVRTRGAEFDVPLVKANGDQKRSLAAEVNRFVDDPSVARFEVHEDTRLIGWAFGLFVAWAGVVCLLAIERVRLVLDRDAGILRLRQRRWFGVRRSDIPLARVRGVEKEEFAYRRTRSWSVIFRLDGGAEMPVTRTPLFTDKSADQALELITGWLAGGGPAS